MQAFLLQPLSAFHFFQNLEVALHCTVSFILVPYFPFPPASSSNPDLFFNPYILGKNPGASYLLLFLFLPFYPLPEITVFSLKAFSEMRNMSLKIVLNLWHPPSVSTRSCEYPE